MRLTYSPALLLAELAVLGWLLPVRLLFGADAWTIRVEEPTGLYPRTNEVVEVPYDKLGGKRGAWVVTNPQGEELDARGAGESEDEMTRLEMLAASGGSANRSAKSM